jgi:hypothetical protein
MAASIWRLAELGKTFFASCPSRRAPQVHPVAHPKPIAHFGALLAAPVQKARRVHATAVSVLGSAVLLDQLGEGLIVNLPGHV